MLSPPAQTYHSSLGRLIIAAVLALLAVMTSTAEAAVTSQSRLIKVAVKNHPNHSRVSLSLDQPAEYSLSVVGERIIITFRKTGGTLFKRFRNYSDRFVNGIRISPYGEDLRVTIRAREGEPEVLPLWVGDMNLLLVDVGPKAAAGPPPVNEDRQAIWNGAGKLVQEFDPPFKPVFPFLPTDRRELLAVISEQDAKLFMIGEAALYKGKAAQAEELFKAFSTRESPVRPLACYRLGEALYILQKYDAALQAFREGEKLWPEYMTINPAAAFYYADSIVRSGDFVGGRKSLTRLISRLATRKYAPLLLVRLADTLARQKHDMEALAIYRTVAANFPTDKAGSYATLKLADRRILSVRESDYRPLLQEYQKLVNKAADASLREEALFKVALLESLYGPPPAALEVVKQYERKYPRGLFIHIARGMREELIPLLARDLYAAKDYDGLVSLMKSEKEYLSRCFADADFIVRIDEAYTTLGLLKNEIALFGELLGREWTTASAPFMLMRIMDHALALADFPLAETSARSFIQRYPRHEAIWPVKEKLGKICFMKNDMAAVVTELGWLAETSRSPASHESYYFLGKAMIERQNQKGGEKLLARFISLVKDQTLGSGFLADAYYLSAAARASFGDTDTAMQRYQAGLEVAGDEERDQFLYKMGEVSLQQGKEDEARVWWERLVKEGVDEVWKKMASQSLADLAWHKQYREMSK